jgi:DNA polymerase III subunit alpha
VFTSIFDFCERVQSGVLNKAALENLVKCGAFDSVHAKENRAGVIVAIEAAVQAAQRAALDRASGQAGLFGGGGAGGPASPATASTPTTTLPKTTAWAEAEALAKEKEVLGFYVSSHPLERWKFWSGAFATCDTPGLKQCAQDTRVVLAAMVASARHIVVRNGKSAGQKMAILTVEDSAGSAECVMFTECFATYGHLAVNEGVVFVLGRVDTSRGDPQIIVDRLVPIDGVPMDSGKVRVFVDELRHNGDAPGKIERVAAMMRGASERASERGGGNGAEAGGPHRFPVEVIIGTTTHVAVLAVDPKLRVALTSELIKGVQDELGSGMVRIVGGFTLEKDKPKPWEKKKKFSSGGGEE